MILVTGGNGFVGSKLKSLLRDEGYEVLGVSRIGDDINGDLSNSTFVERLMKELDPEYVFHLAGSTDIPTSIAKPLETFNNNVSITHNILESVRKSERCRMLFSSSASLYFHLGHNDAIREYDGTSSNNPHTLSKEASELLCNYYVQNHNVRVVITRSFNHTGPGQAARFFVPNFCRQVALMEMGSQDSIKVGNLEVERDFLDARDVASAYITLMKEVSQGLYNVCSGTPTALQTIVNKVESCSKLDHLNILQDSSLMRGKEVKTIFGDNSNLKSLGWEPKINFLDQTIPETLDYWRNNVLRSI